MRMNKTYFSRTWLLAVAMSLFTLTSAYAQKTISGTVTDENGEGLPGVSVVIGGTSTGTATNLDGKYQLNLPEGATNLVFSFIGYQPQTIEIGSQTVIDVQLSLDLEQLEEVVVIGYGVVKKEDATGSVTAIDTKSFNKGVISSPQDLLTGRAAGVQITSNGGAPGSGSTIRIRGGSSLSASNNPLFVIDGVIVSDEGVSGLSNPLSTINPNDIESMTVLKDASATAIYGSRASNGVILVKTKRGRQGASLKLNYTGNVGINVLPKTLDVFSGAEYRSLVQDRIAAGKLPNQIQDFIDQNPTTSTDWQKEIFSQSVSTDHNLSASGSFKNIPYRASVGYLSQDGILETSAFQRTSFGLAVDPSFLNDNLKLKIDAKYSMAKNTFADGGAIGSAVIFDPTAPVYFENGDFYYHPSEVGGSNPSALAPTNPLALLKLRDNQADVDRFIGSFQVDYSIPSLKGLRLHLNLSTDRSDTDGTDVTSEKLSSQIASGRGRRITTYTGEYRNQLLETYANYTTKIEALESNVDFMVGYSWQKFERVNPSRTVDDFQTTIADGDPSENFLVSFFGRMNYTMKEKYLLTVTLRRDGSSRFLGDNQFGLFPAVALGWKVKEESFLKDVDAISNMKVRLGYGVTGQENIGGSYPALGLVTNSENQSLQYFNGQYIPTIKFEGFDANLKWEETTTYNAGLDISFLKGRLSATIDYYKRETKDLLNFIDIPIGSNFTNKITTNIGSLENTGIEIALDAIVIEKDDISLDMGINLTRNENKITKLIGNDDPNYLGVATGGISGNIGNNIQVHQVGSPASSFFVLEQIYDQNGKPIEGLFKDQNNDGIINDFDKVKKENPAPVVYMGLYSRFRYKNFDFSFNARMNVGNYVYNNVASNLGQYGNMFVSGAPNNIARSVLETNFSTPQYFSDYYVQNASFFRMDNMTVGYRLPKLINEKLDVYLNFTVQNAFVITNYDGLDPEVDGGIDNNIYPRPRVFLFGANVNF